ncbi:hypothetical protein AAJV73_03015 [Cyanobium sp. BSA11S]|uniref:hypothetical protein n=1 Tax=Cyanobium sp. BSA11S TaxID=3108224 RepID=UPI003D813087
MDLAHRDHFYRRFSTRSYQDRLERIQAFLPVSIEILKDVPYHLPPVLSGLKINYFGDGIGIYTSEHQLWWHPEPPPRLDRPISAVPSRQDDSWS